jgi:hypothetical protein
VLQVPQPIPQYDTLTDTVPELWQFIMGLRSDDLVAEMIQNEIDAGSTETILSFEEQRMVCSGNGDPIDGDGWIRLQYLRGAGDRAPRKRSLIGIKNHGLKACFAIGDDIYIRSDGQYAHQTLYKHGHLKSPCPGATTSPTADPLAPKGKGTIVEVTYRRRPIVVDQGEPVQLAVCTSAIIESLFLSAVAEVPMRFIGIMRPGYRSAYMIELRHHRLGSVRFDFRATRVRKQSNLTTYLRTCDGSSDDLTLAVPSTRERAVLEACARPGGQMRDIAEFYSTEKRVLVEVAWREDPSGRALPVRGQLRYPIAYAATGPAASSGLGVHYSAPFVSDNERHGLAEGANEWNMALKEACDRLLVSAVKGILIPRVGARALDLLVDPVAPSADRISSLVGMCVAARALPVMQRKKRARGTAPAKAGKRWRRCVIPCFTASPDRVAPELVAISPVGEWLLASGVHPVITRLLTSRKLHGYGTDIIVFDEHAVLARLSRGVGGGTFPWPSEKARIKDLADPKIASKHLDAIAKAGDIAPNGPSRRAVLEALAPKNVEVPDDNGALRLVKDLKLSANLPHDLPDLTLPPLVHSDLVRHEIFKMQGWVLGKFGFGEFLINLSSGILTQNTAKSLFSWLCTNTEKIPAKWWPNLRSLRIWPIDGAEELCAIDSFCLPRDPSIDQILRSVLKRPSKSVMRFAGAIRKRRLSLTFRSCPNGHEIKAWMAPQLDAFAPGQVLTEGDRTRFRVLEKDLARLATEPRLADLLAPFADRVPALSRAGILERHSDLVHPGKFIVLHLRDENLLDRSESVLDGLFSVGERPTTAMVEGALRADPQNIASLIPRLKALADLAGSDRHSDLGIADVPCIPIHGDFRAPSALAFKGNEGNYWGAWRDELSGRNLSQADQALYKRAGVLSAEPRADTSKLFFAWLSENAMVVEKHLAQILRHFAHERGVRSWWAMDESVRCLPVQGPGGLLLISYRDATSKTMPCYVDDFPELGDAIRGAGVNILLAVDKHQDVRRPITEILIEAQVKSLRLSADKPIAVVGDNPRDAPTWAMDVLSQFRSERMATGLQKRIVALGIQSRLMAVRWHRNLQAVTRIVRADKVVATYKLGRQRLLASVRQAFDPSSGSLWLADMGDEEVMEDAYFEALAERIFVHGAPPYCAPALEKTLKIEVKEAQRVTTAPDESHDGADTDEDDTTPSEAPEAHHDWKPDPTRNLPSPAPLPGNAANARIPTGRGLNRGSNRPIVPDELEQTLQLKQNHYAWHCQVGLARQAPSVLAPNGSYIEHQENRQRVIEAHHPDAVDAGGARHAGNILILSHLTHHQYGRHISRGQITDALKSDGTARQVTFQSGTSSTVVDGVVVKIVLPATGEVVPIFFTNWHREYWLSKAR